MIRVVLCTVALLIFGDPLRATALELSYSVPTSAPDGRAVCAVRGSLKKGTPTQIDVSLSPTAGEASLDFTITPKGAEGSSSIQGALGAGTQAGCDIFPDAPTTFSQAWDGAAGTISGVFDLHAHPGSDCESPSVAKGTVSLSVGTLDVKFKRLKCDTSGSHANLGTKVSGDTTGTKGGIMSQQMRVMNHGPADAANARLMVRPSKNLFLMEASLTKGVCHLDSQKNSATCQLGSLPSLGTSDVTLFMIPLKAGPAQVTYTVGADNKGGALPAKNAIRGNVAQGNNAILSVTVKCKGAAGSVAINPNGTGGVTTCTCPDPNDTTRETVICVETYAQKTTVNLTPTATTGQFNKWSGACAGNPAACGLTLDPADQPPDKATTAKFK